GSSFRARDKENPRTRLTKGRDGGVECTDFRAIVAVPIRQSNLSGRAGIIPSRRPGINPLQRFADNNLGRGNDFDEQAKLSCFASPFDLAHDVRFASSRDEGHINGWLDRTHPMRSSPSEYGQPMTGKAREGHQRFLGSKLPLKGPGHEV